MSRAGWRRYKKDAHTSAADRLEAAAYVLRDVTKESISEGYPPASSPGEPPHVRTGRLRTSIAADVDRRKLAARVGTNLEYALPLEFGTSRMAARPFLRPGLDQSRAELIRIMKGDVF